jgi:hypothetical protein
VPTSNPSDNDAEARLAKSKANFEFFQELEEAGVRLDWAATALFYSAVMLIDAHGLTVGNVSITRGDVFADHRDRNAYVGSLDERLHFSYFRLFNLSKRARYQVAPITRAELERNEAEYRTVKREIAKKVKVDW